MLNDEYLISNIQQGISNVQGGKEGEKRRTSNEGRLGTGAINWKLETENRRLTMGGEIKAVADDEVMKWSMKKSLGDRVSVMGANGATVELLLAGALKTSVFQGYVLIPEEAFRTVFGDGGGARVMLVDCPTSKTAEIAAALRRSLGRYGVVVESCALRLSRFRSVENTYLSIFLSLGGLGLLLGCVGFGVLSMRGMVERRSEFALMSAVGFPKERITSLITLEGAFVIGAGALSGCFSAGVAALPAVLNSAVGLPWGEVAAIFAGVLISAFLFNRQVAKKVG